jgi:hypothetical protein
MAEIKRLSEVVNPLMLGGSRRKLRDYLGKPLILWGCLKIQGKRGDYWRMLVSEAVNGEKFVVSTGAAQPSEVLASLDNANDLPLEVVFIEEGDRLLMS